MTNPWTDKVALVTGGTKGIGYAIAARLAREGMRVAICGRTAESTARAVESLESETGAKVAGRPADVSVAEDAAGLVEWTFASLGSLDVLVNNAGIGIFRSVADLEISDWQRLLDTNLSGVFYCCHAAIPLMRRQGGGFILNISSLAGKNPFAGGAAYNASKFGLNGFSEAMMLDHRNEDIRVCSIMPGSVNTGFSGRASNDDWRIAPEDIAGIVWSVLSLPARTLVSRVEVRPSKPRKG